MFGGRSVEHEISILTALQALMVLDTERYEAIPVYVAPDGKWYTGKKLYDKKIYPKFSSFLGELDEVTILPKPGINGLVKINKNNEVIPVDVVIPAFHGQYGEDGAMQGLLELANIAYSGASIPSSAVAMNKYLCKLVLSAEGIPVLPGKLVYRTEGMKDLDSHVQELLKWKELPLFVKPVNLGSSIGVSRVSKPEELAPALVKVFRYDDSALIETCVTNLMEINVSVRLDNGEPTASVVEIPVSETGVLSYEDKYMKEGGKKSGPKESQGMASLVRKIDPEELDPKIKEQVRGYAVKAYRILNCNGTVRFDFIMDTGKGELYFNELNPFPGSCAFYLWAKSSPRVLFTDIISGVIEDAITRQGLKDSLDRNIGFKALK